MPNARSLNPAPTFKPYRTSVTAADNGGPYSGSSIGLNCSDYARLIVQVTARSTSNPIIKVYFYNDALGIYVYNFTASNGKGAGVNFEFIVNALGRQVYIEVTGTLAGGGVDLYVSGDNSHSGSVNTPVPSGSTGASTGADVPNNISLGQYKATKPTLTDAQFNPFLLDVNGNEYTREAYAPVAEDNVNGVIWVRSLPLPVSLGAWSVAQSTALAAQLQVKTSAGVLRYITGRIDGTAGAGSKWVMVLNSAAAVSNANTANLRAPLKKVHVSSTDDEFVIDLMAEGIYFSAGCVIALSTSDFSLTLDGAFLSVTAFYK